MGLWDRELIELLPESVRVYASAGAGFDWVDTAILAEHGESCVCFLLSFTDPRSRGGKCGSYIVGVAITASMVGKMGFVENRAGPNPGVRGKRKEKKSSFLHLSFLRTAAANDGM